MTQDFVKVVREEVFRLREELEADVRFQRLQELEKVLALYGEVGGANSPSKTAPTNRRPPKRQPSPERTKIVNRVVELLKMRIGPLPTREIYDLLLSEGFDIPGKVPANNLSAMLSNSENFESRGRQGWVLSPSASVGGPQESIPEEVVNTDDKDDELAKLLS